MRRPVVCALVSVTVIIACTANKAQPPDGITAQNGGAQAGNGLGADIESGSGQYDPSAPSAFAPSSRILAEIALWEGAAAFSAPTAPPATATVPDTSPTPTPSAAPSVTPPSSPTPTPSACGTPPPPTADLDLDGYPDTLETVMYGGCALDSGLGSVAATGSWTFVDTSTGNPAFAFQRTANLGITATTASGSIQATTTGSQPGSNNHFVLQQNATLLASDSVHQLSHSVNWATDYAPSTAWGPKLPPVAGTMSISGGWNFGFDDLSADTVVSTVTPLTFDPTCATRITAGAISATFTNPDQSSHALVVTWTACGQRSTTVDGAPAQ